jgi:hypothetical protein
MAAKVARVARAEREETPTATVERAAKGARAEREETLTATAAVERAARAAPAAAEREETPPPAARAARAAVPPPAARVAMIMMITAPAGTLMGVLRARVSVASFVSTDQNHRPSFFFCNSCGSFHCPSGSHVGDHVTCLDSIDDCTYS